MTAEHKTAIQPNQFFISKYIPAQGNHVFHSAAFWNPAETTLIGFRCHGRAGTLEAPYNSTAFLIKKDIQSCNIKLQ